jgi:hypothetical protein
MLLLAHDGEQTGRASQPYGASVLVVAARADGSLSDILEAAATAEWLRRLLIVVSATGPRFELCV